MSKYQTLREDKKYVSLIDTLQKMWMQVAVSVPYCSDTLPDNVVTPDQLWKWLKPQLKYENDPPNVELLQSVPSLFCDNYHGMPGAGDCDCFTICVTAYAYVLSLPVDWVVAGNSDEAPSHIYPVVGGVVMDMTEEYIDAEREYRNAQTLPICE